MNKTDIRPGDKIAFGHLGFAYESIDPIPLYWTVLDVSGDELLIISDRLIAELPYNEEEGPIEWEDCTLRKWLNSVFVRAAFSSGDKRLLIEAPLPLDEGVTDRVFILSTDEIEKYLSDKVERTDDGVQYIPSRTVPKLGAAGREIDDFWWVRDTVSFDPRFGSMIRHVDSSGYYGKTPSYCKRRVRPVCRVKLPVTDEEE